MTPAEKKAAYDKSYEARPDVKVRRNAQARARHESRTPEQIARTRARKAEEHRANYSKPEVRSAVCERVRSYNAEPENRVRRDEYVRAYRAIPGVKARAAAQARWRKYGITSSEYDSMLITQSGRCAVCAIPMKSPHVDHCHKTGKVRGLLCYPCNTTAGRFGDDPDRVRVLVDYLER